MKNQENWTIEIKPNATWFDIDLREVWNYRDLLILFIKRDIVALYKQTILGPLWYIIQPILTTMMFSFVFGRIAGISTDNVPPLLFYLSGVTIWGYFSDCLNRTSNTFVSNQNIFGKVYFPRIIVPGSVVLSTMLKFLIQFLIFLALWFYYYVQGKVVANYISFLLPLLVIQMALMSMGFGMIFSAMTTKYRDLQFLLSFAVQLWMYITPIIYPLSSIPEKYLEFIKLNPVTPIVECFRYGFLGHGFFEWSGLLYSSVFAIFIFVIGIMVFARVEKNFMDTV